MAHHGGWVYLTTTKRHTALYIGSTTDILRRSGEHRSRYYPNSFTATYNADKLVWFEHHATIQSARAREQQLKAGNRKRKEALINAMNPEWRDLYPDLLREAEGDPAKRP